MPYIVFYRSIFYYEIFYHIFSQRSQTGCVLDKRRYDEIIYYLTKYGSHKQFVRFYVRHGLMRKAAAYIRDRVSFLVLYFV